MARLIQAVVNSVPANADVHVEINQNPRGQDSQIEIQHVSAPQQLSQGQQHQPTLQTASMDTSGSSSGNEPGKISTHPSKLQLIKFKYRLVLSLFIYRSSFPY